MEEVDTTQRATAYLLKTLRKMTQTNARGHKTVYLPEVEYQWSVLSHCWNITLNINQSDAEN